MGVLGSPRGWGHSGLMGTSESHSPEGAMVDIQQQWPSVTLGKLVCLLWPWFPNLENGAMTSASWVLVIQ